MKRPCAAMNAGKPPTKSRAAQPAGVGYRPGMRSFLGILLLLLAAPASPQVDGPYVVRNSAGGLEAWSVEGQDRRTQPATVGATFIVPAVEQAHNKPPFCTH